MTQLHPYLTFQGNCREAMTFYQACLGGELSLQTVKDSPMADQWPAQLQDNILHASLTKGSLALFGSDMAGSEGIVKGNTVSLSLTCSSKQEIETCFANLSAGGQITHPLHEFYAGTIGNFTDQFGMDWLLYCEQNQNSKASE